MEEKKSPSDGSSKAGKESKPARSEPKNSIGNPDVSVLKKDAGNHATYPI